MATEELTREVYSVSKPERFPEIYVFVNGGEPGWYSVQALTEDGEFIAGHICSHPGYGPHDMGFSSDWKHEAYRERYPQGFRLVWIDDVRGDARLSAAHAKHMAAGEEGTAWQREHKKTGEENQPSVKVEVSS